MISTIAVIICVALIVMWIVIPMISNRRARERARRADVKAHRAEVHRFHSEQTLENEKKYHREREEFKRANRVKRLEQINRVADELKRRRK